jgi:formylglycine-generating enzyme
MKKISSLLKPFFLIAVMILIFSCGKERSNTTGWNYNDPKNGGFEKAYYEEQETGPGLVLIEGGTFTMGRVEQDVFYDWNNVPRRVSVSSFYMDETEISNLNYLEYLHWLGRIYGEDYPEVYKKALPDTLVWRDKLAFNEPYVEYYLRHPSYRDYPVVGINWLQANDFCAWRTDRVNEFILIREGLFEYYIGQTSDDNFNTDAYLAGQYESGKAIDGLPNLGPDGGARNVRMEDGILLPRYRLPTEAEWEYAAYGLIGNTMAEMVIERKLYPWNGHGVRNSNEKYIGQILANYKRGAGDNMGVAGRLNDNADVTAPVYSYWPNDYGLYNMAGNVSEWVMDVYRPLSGEDKSDFRAFRGNVFKTQVRDEEGNIDEKLDKIVYDKDSNIVGLPGQVQWREVNLEQDDLASRRNYRQSDNINFLDGDLNSSIYFFEGEDSERGNKLMYEYSVSSMVNDRARVYKGGSWKDRTYWMNPGTRRFLDEKQATDFLGFRCAMTRVGSPVGLGGRGK